MTQSFASALIILRRMVQGADLWLKNLGFRFFQIVQLISMVMVAITFRFAIELYSGLLQN
jgi:hypothetical protein